MRIMPYCLLLVGGLTGVSLGADPTDHLNDSQLTIHTLVREDIFAGWRADDMKRYERGERNIQKLLELRPDARAELLGWKGGAELFRAVLAHESENEQEFQQHLQASKAAFAEAKTLGPENAGVASLMGGSHAMFADRLPEDERAAAWASSYEGYQILWKQQQSQIDKLPTHFSHSIITVAQQMIHDEFSISCLHST